jgi:hypothetical protein
MIFPFILVPPLLWIESTKTPSLITILINNPQDLPSTLVIKPNNAFYQFPVNYPSELKSVIKALSLHCKLIHKCMQEITTVPLKPRLLVALH